MLRSVAGVANALSAFGNSLHLACLEGGAHSGAAVTAAAAALIHALRALGVDQRAAVNLGLVVAAELEGDDGEARLHAGLLARVRDGFLAVGRREPAAAGAGA